MLARVNAGTAELRTGAQPADPDTGNSGTLFATLTFGATAFGATNGSGVATANAITSGTATATVAGTSTFHVRCRRSAGNGSTAEFDCKGTFRRSCTIDNTTDVITEPGHARANGDPIILTHVSGGLPGGYSAATVLYVINTNTGAGTYQLSSSVGGSAFNFSSNGSNLRAYAGDAQAVVDTDGVTQDSTVSCSLFTMSMPNP